MSGDFKFEAKGGQEIEVWRAADGSIQLAMHDVYDSSVAAGLTPAQARQIAAALIEAADRVDCVV